MHLELVGTSSNYLVEVITTTLSSTESSRYIFHILIVRYFVLKIRCCFLHWFMWFVE